MFFRSGIQKAQAWKTDFDSLGPRALIPKTKQAHDVLNRNPAAPRIDIDEEGIAPLFSSTSHLLKCFRNNSPLVHIRKKGFSILMVAMLGHLAMAQSPRPVKRSHPVTQTEAAVTIQIVSGSKISETPLPKPVPGRQLTDQERRVLRQRVAPLPAQGSQDATPEQAIPGRPRPDQRPGVERSIDSPMVNRPMPQNEELSDAPAEVDEAIPQGKVPSVNQVVLHFTQQMIALQAVGETELPLGIELQPNVTGNWRWLDVQTLAFEPDKPLPGSTLYRVSVPQTLTTLHGNPVASQQFEFETPPVALKGFYFTSGRHAMQPFIGLTFSQNIEHKTLLQQLEIRAEHEGKSQVIPFHQATSEDLEQDESTNNYQHSRWAESKTLFIRTDSNLPVNAKVTVRIRSKSFSAEGPIPASFEKQFKTPAPLEFLEASCGYRGACRPENPWQFRFNNNIDEASFDPGWIRIEPKVPDSDVNIYGKRITLSGSRLPNQVYKVQLDPSIRDIYGQTLSKPIDIEFETEKGRPELWAEWSNRIVTIPLGKKATTSISAKNLDAIHLQINRVTSQDFLKYQKAFERSRQVKFDPASMISLLPGKQVQSQTFKEPHGSVEIDLKDYLNRSGTGQFICYAYATQSGSRNSRLFQLGWVQISNLGIHFMEDAERMVFQSYDLNSGRRSDQVDIHSLGSDATARTSTSNLMIPKDQKPGFQKERVWYAKKGEDELVFEGWRPYFEQNDRVIWYVSSDRGLYQAGERVHIFGTLRYRKGGPKGDLSLKELAKNQVSWTLQDSRGNKLVEGQMQLNDQASFDLNLDLPNDVELGTARLLLRMENRVAKLHDLNYSYPFEIQAFRVPEFEVTSQILSNGPFLQGETIDVEAQAAYYAGGGLGDSPVMWNFKATETDFAPQGWDDFWFGIQRPWWRYSTRKTIQANGQGQTNLEGKDRTAVKLEQFKTPVPFNLQVEASVQDQNQQTWSAREQTIVHPAALYVGVDLDRRFLEENQPFQPEFVVTDIDGKIQAGASVDVKLQPNSWNEDDDPKTVWSTQVQSKADPSPIKIQAQEAGSYLLILEVTDKAGRLNRTSVPVWFTGRTPFIAGDDEGELELILEQESVEVGEKARLMVRAPFKSGWGTLTLCRDGILKQIPFELRDGMSQLEFEINELHLPLLNLHVHVQETGGELPLTSLTQETAVKVPFTPRKLQVEAIVAEPEMAPGQSGQLDVYVEDATGNPISHSEVTVFIVDEALLALDGFELEDPLLRFYPDPPVGFHFLNTMNTMQRFQQNAGVFDTAEAAPAPMEAMRVGAAPPQDASSAQPIAVREDFAACLLFQANLTTDGSGKTTIPFQLKDNLTRFRVMVFASSGPEKFGTGNAPITSRLPLMVRPSPPRFLNLGDRFTLPVGLQNQTDQDLEVLVHVEGQNLRFLDENSSNGTYRPQVERAVQVPTGGRVTLALPARPESFGEAHAQVSALAINRSGVEDAQRFSLPVLIPVSREDMAIYGEMEGDALHECKFQKPMDSYPGLSSIDIQLTSTQLHTLHDAYLYVRDYPFECTEQLASRLIAILILKDLLNQQTREKTDADLDPQLQAIVQKLVSNQLSNGGFGFWKNRGSEWPFLTIHAAHALVRARSAGLDGVQSNLNRALKRITQINTANFPTYTDAQILRLQCYAAYVRALSGENIEIPPTFWDRKDLTRDAKAWLSSALAMSGDLEQANSMVQPLRNQVVQTAASAQLNELGSPDSFYFLGSQVRDQALFIEAMLQTHPQDPLNTKLIRGLLDHRRKGRWNNTQDNLWSLIAMRSYALQKEAMAPDFTVGIWSSDHFLADETFEGQNQDRFILKKDLDPFRDTDSILIQKEGEGRLYYRLGMEVVPANFQLEAQNQGFEITRHYEAVENSEDVQQNEDGSWRIRAGAIVRVVLQFRQISVRHHLALVDSLPAGLEIINPELKVSTQAEPANRNSLSSRSGVIWWQRNWFEHQNLRDDRVEVFAARVPAGSRRYSYLARATTKGTFHTPAARVEEMYHPETYGRTSTEVVIIE